MSLSLCSDASLSDGWPTLGSRLGPTGPAEEAAGTVGGGGKHSAQFGQSLPRRCDPNEIGEVGQIQSNHKPPL